MPSTPGAPRLASTRLTARPRLPGESIRSHSETSRPGMTASSGGAGRPLRSAAVLNGTHRLLPAAGPRPRDGCDHRDQHEQPRFLRLTRRSALPSHTLIPAGTTASADFCPVSSRLTAGAVGAAATTAQPTPGRPPRIRTTNFPYARRVYVTTLPVVTGFTFLSRLTQIAPPSTRFVSLGAGFRLGLPSHPASRRRSCLRLGVSTTSSSRGLSPPSDRPCRAYSRRRLRRRGPGTSVPALPWEARPAHAGRHCRQARRSRWLNVTQTGYSAQPPCLGSPLSRSRPPH
jgi:hypothetical protein